jgi:putative membrane protein
MGGKIDRPKARIRAALRRSVEGKQIGVFTAALMPMPAWAQTSNPNDWNWHMHGGWGHMMGWGGAMFGGIGMPLFWVFIIVLIYLLARGYVVGWPSQPSSLPPHSGPTALDILQVRYAKGEITKDEYREMKKTLVE